MIKKTLFAAVAIFSLLPIGAQAAVGDNCPSALIESVPDHASWENVHVLRSAEGKIWQRGIIRLPSDEIVISENGSIVIPSLVLPKTETIFFLFSPQSNAVGGTVRPTPGTCFEGNASNAGGNAELTVAAPFFWNALGKEIMIDVFFLADSHASESKNNLHAGSFGVLSQNKVRRFRVNIDRQSGEHLERQGQIIHREGRLIGYAPKTANENNSRINSTNLLTNQPMTLCKPLCGGLMSLAIKLDPAFLAQDLHGKSLQSIGGTEIVIGRSPGPHTYYAGVGDGFLPLPSELLQKITRQSITLEAVKRALLGYENVGGNAPGLVTFEAEALRKAAFGLGGYSEETVLLAQQIAVLMTKSEERLQAAEAISNLLLDNYFELATDPFLDWDIADSLLEIVPLTPGNHANWSADFVALVQFWTGMPDENLCLMLNDDGFSKSLRSMPYEFSQCGLEYVTGTTPKLVLRSTKPMTINPEFHDAILVHSNYQFVKGSEGFFLSHGKKPILDYRYKFTQPFATAEAGEICLKKGSLPQTVNQMAEKYALNSQEKMALSKELSANLPVTDGLIRLGIADPNAIAKRIRWLEKGTPLSLFQLYFKIEPGQCFKENLSLPDLQIPKERDGFEAGIIE